MTTREGTMLGPYRLVRLIGGGGAGDVYLAERAATGAAGEAGAGKAAVKVLRGGPGDATAQDIVRQVRLAASARQAHVLPVYDAGEHDGALYIAMAHAAGGSLGAALQPGGPTAGTNEGTATVRLPLGPGVVARLVGQAARALQAMHERGLAHGDLKPNNLFVRTAPHGGPMLALGDFGQAVVVRAAAAAAQAGESTWSGAALRCAAPEQLAGAAPLPASDQYALAAIAYLLLTGRYPFAGDGPALAEAIQHTPPAPPSSLAAPAAPDVAIGPTADAVLLRALAKAPEARYPDIVTFAQALDGGLTQSAVARSGVTREFAALGGLPRATMPPSAMSPAAPLATGTRRTTRGPLTGPDAPPSETLTPIRGAATLTAPIARGTGAPRPGVPRTSPARGLTPRQWVVAGVAALLVVAVVVAGALGLRALFAGPGGRAALPNFSGLDYAPTVTPDAAQAQRYQALAQAAQGDLQAATAGQPLFSDALTSNANHWAVDGKQSFFGSDHQLHLYNHDLQAIYSLDQPVAAPDDFVVSVDMTFLHGSLSDFAGLRLRVAPPADAHSAYYSVLLTPDGRYEFWRFDGSRWQVLDFGYAAPIKRGLGQTNTLTVLAHGEKMTVFVNGQYVTAVTDALLPTVHNMTMGPTVIYAGTEAAYAHYTVYQVNG
ncbi:MAG TPA: protein kinase [Ktedonobacterales bacterium]